MRFVLKFGIGLVGLCLFALPAAQAQSAEYGATNFSRTQTVLNGTAIKSYTPSTQPVFEVENKAVYDSGSQQFRQVEVEKSAPKSVQVGATIFGEDVEATASLVKLKLPGVEANLLGAGGSANYAVGLDGTQFQISGDSGAEAYLIKLNIGGNKRIGDNATNLGGSLGSESLVVSNARVSARTFAGLEGVGLEVGGTAFAGAKVDGTLALKAMICKLGVGAGVTGELSAGAGVSANAGLSVDWDKLEVTVGAKLAATLGLGAGGKANVTVSLEGLFDPGELARCLGEKAKAIHAAGVDGTATLIQPAFNAYYQDPAILRNIKRLEASESEFQRQVRAILAAETAKRQRAKKVERDKALALVGPFSLSEFPMLYWDGRNIDSEAYYKTAYEAVDRRNALLREAGFNPRTLGITPLHYGIPVKLSDFTRPDSVPGLFPPGFGPSPTRSSGGIQVQIGKTSLRNLYPH